MAEPVRRAGARLNVICRFRFGAPTFRAPAPHRTAARNIPRRGPTVSFCTVAVQPPRRRSPQSICCPLSTPFTSLRHPTRNAARRDKGREGTEGILCIVALRWEKRSRAMDIFLSVSHLCITYDLWEDARFTRGEERDEIPTINSRRSILFFNACKFDIGEV